MSGPQTDEQAMRDVFSSDRDRGGNDAPPPVEQQPAAPPSAEQQANEPPPSDDQNAEPKRRSMLDDLRSERQKRQDAEAELKKWRDESQQRFSHYDAQLQALQSQIASRGQPQQPQQPPPDFVLDPEGAARHLQQSIEHRILNSELNNSERFARVKFGDDVVNSAFAAAGDDIKVQALRSADPYTHLVEWYRREQAMKETGGDIAAFRARIAKEEREKVLAELKAGKGPTATQSFPGTLATATAAGDQGMAPVSDETMMAGIFSSDRKRR